MIKFTCVDKMYPDGNKTLKNINLKIDKGEFVFLVGRSGAGKSTLLRLITREEKASKGSVSVLGDDITSIKLNKLHNYRRNIGIVFQDYKLLKDKTVYENVELAMRVVGADPKDIKVRVMEVLQKVGIYHKCNKYPDELSGGECQRVGIARAIVNKPSIIVADECTGNLDVENSRKIVDLLESINKEGVTIVMATHDMEILKNYHKRIVAIDAGKIIEDTKREKYEVSV
ncbi:MAG: cell division ATP-binding protein FtsE [Peptostreptococcaceae bacterium]